MRIWLSTIVSSLVFVAGFYLLGISTHHWTVWTSESARKLDIRANPRWLPDVNLIDDNGDERSLHDFTAQPVLLDFIFTRCPTYCVGLGIEFMNLQQDLRQLEQADRPALLSLSFDLQYDTADRLAAYLKQYRADPQLWRAARIKTEAGKTQLFELLKIVAIPDPQAGFIHNTGIYLVKQGRVVDVFELSETERIMQVLQQFGS